MAKQNENVDILCSLETDIERARLLLEIAIENYGLNCSKRSLAENDYLLRNTENICNLVCLAEDILVSVNERLVS